MTRGGKMVQQGDQVKHLADAAATTFSGGSLNVFASGARVDFSVVYEAATP
jgi:hypothetical protein